MTWELAMSNNGEWISFDIGQCSCYDIEHAYNYVVGIISKLILDNDHMTVVILSQADRKKCQQSLKNQRNSMIDNVGRKLSSWNPSGKVQNKQR